MSRALSRSNSNSGSCLATSRRRAIKFASTNFSAFCNSVSASAVLALSLNHGDVAIWAARSTMASRGPALRGDPDRGLVRHSGENFGDMAGLDFGAVALQLADHVHQAAEIAGKQQIGTGRRDGGGLLGDDGIRNFWILHAERAAEATADLGVAHLGEPQPFHGGEQAPRLIAHA